MKNKRNKKLPKWAIVIIIFAFILCLLPIIGVVCLISLFYFNYDYDFDDNDLSLKNINAEYSSLNNSYLLKGTISNFDDEDYYFVLLEYSLYDSNHNLVSVESEYIGNIDNGEVKNFTIVYSEKDARDISSYELTDIKGF